MSKFKTFPFSVSLKKQTKKHNWKTKTFEKNIGEDSSYKEDYLWQEYGGFEESTVRRFKTSKKVFHSVQN